MEELFSSVYRILPTKVTPSKYVSLFAVRPDGNLLFSCFGGHSSIEGSFDAIDALGGVTHHLLGDMHFAARYSDDVHARFGIDTQCSEIEAPDVKRKVKHVRTFPFERHALADGVEVIPTPGHRPGAASYLVDVGGRQCLFAGDTIYHDGASWRALASKKNRSTMLETLAVLDEVDFDVLLANTGVSNPVCCIALDGGEPAGGMDKAAFLDGLRHAL